MMLRIGVQSHKKQFTNEDRSSHFRKLQMLFQNYCFNEVIRDVNKQTGYERLMWSWSPYLLECSVLAYKEIRPRSNPQTRHFEQKEQEKNISFGNYYKFTSNIKKVKISFYPFFRYQTGYKLGVDSFKRYVCHILRFCEPFLKNLITLVY